MKVNWPQELNTFYQLNLVRQQGSIGGQIEKMVHEIDKDRLIMENPKIVHNSERSPNDITKIKGNLVSKLLDII
ncbi:MAG: hypothetical protein HOJ35_00710 [Bdellovibrionales bacterium]|jgi:hypothetical protein|nr:hypothetical protein [Bdellovibrionales bacterium]